MSCNRFRDLSLSDLLGQLPSNDLEIVNMFEIQHLRMSAEVVLTVLVSRLVGGVCT